MKRLTDTQKSEIRDLRMQGLGYKAIAEKLSLSRETVRSFCTRNHVQKESAERQDAIPMNGKKKVRSGGTVFIVTTEYSKNATETLEDKLKSLILDAANRQFSSYQFVQG